MKKFSLALLALAAVIALSSAAKADTVYTTTGAYATAVSGLNLTTVSYPSPGAGGWTSSSAYYDVDGVTFTSASSTIHENDAAYYTCCGGSASPTNYVVVFGQTTDTVTIAFPSSNGFSLYLGGGSNPAGETGSVTLSDSYVYDFTAPAYVSSGAPLDFFGFTSSTPITSAVVTFNGPDDASTEYGTIGDLTYATPEPSSLLLLGTGLLGLAFVAFRKVKSSGLVMHS